MSLTAHHNLCSFLYWFLVLIFYSAGVLVVAAGVIIIERAKSSGESGEAHGAQDVTIGVILIVIQSILSGKHSLF